MDVHMTNNVLFVVIAVLMAVIITLLVKRSKALDRELDLALKVRSEKLKTQLAEEKREIAEGLLSTEQGKLDKIHLKNFAAWLFDDEEFVSAIASKVDELRPVALDRYNTKQRAELQKRADDDAAAMKRSREIYENNLRASTSITGKERIVSGGGFSGTDAIIPLMTVSNDTTTSFSGGDSCSVDASCM